jgi:hypothetical protein
MVHVAYRYYYQQLLKRDTVFKVLKYLLALTLLFIPSWSFPNLVTSGMQAVR